MQNLALNLCCYRELFEHYPEKYRTIAAAVGYGIGEVAAAVVSGFIKMEDAFWDGKLENHNFNFSAIFRFLFLSVIAKD